MVIGALYSNRRKPSLPEGASMLQGASLLEYDSLVLGCEYGVNTSLLPAPRADTIACGRGGGRTLQFHGFH